jgi:acetoin utilization deacetylase AcuC-like enzyme
VHELVGGTEHEASVAVEDLVRCTPRAATVDELARVHDRSYLDALERFCSSGGGHLDPDTVAMSGSWEIALLAAGAMEQHALQTAMAEDAAVRPIWQKIVALASLGLWVTVGASGRWIGFSG